MPSLLDQIKKTRCNKEELASLCLHKHGSNYWWKIYVQRVNHKCQLSLLLKSIVTLLKIQKYMYKRSIPSFSISFKGTHTVYISRSFYIINQKPMIPRTDFHCITTWVAHSSGVKFGSAFAYFVVSCLLARWQCYSI